MTENTRPLNFVEKIVKEDLENKVVQSVQTRFPPEPNGYLHIGHAKSICLNFGIAETFGGQCNLRFDDTNPEKEDIEYVEAIKDDIRWLGFKWSGDVKFTSNYFDQLHAWAIELIKNDKAYVDDLDKDAARASRGTLKQPGTNSPYRSRSVDENLALFEKMRLGEFDEGHCTLRIKGDMASSNMHMRDPIIYRIRKASHHQTGDKWCIYPSYDFAHGQGDAIEGVTHSICTLEFEEHRPLYNWFIDNLSLPSKPVQHEFSRLEVNYTVTSKRKLKQLVDDEVVDAWNDPRMPTISGMRRRGYTAAAIREFIDKSGVSRNKGVVDVSMLEFAIREDLNNDATRAMCVMHPLKVTLTNYPEDKAETLTAPGHPSREDLGIRELPFSNTLLIDKADFLEEANKKYKRLVIGKRVRLRNAYVIEADEAVKDADGNIIEVKARIIEGTLGHNPEDGIKPKGVIHWVDANDNVDCEVRLYDRLFNDPAPDAGGKDHMQTLNPDSLEILKGCKGEKGLASAENRIRFQFEREGYFVQDSRYSKPDAMVYNRVISLRDTWSK